jgi:hypothetical protein
MLEKMLELAKKRKENESKAAMSASSSSSSGSSASGGYAGTSFFRNLFLRVACRTFLNARERHFREREDVSLIDPVVVVFDL